ncbi:MAG: Co2+/Mg2+ efflux protein ApaG [Rhizobiaceae bacterium]|nr:Co2+/Mg2+ efflux protein ApaG [Rhizobiaceae bacterium]MBL4697112.1 Co2+/Mg2+ efflux protein ApaG [Rhizobiaceae bacterium]MBL4731597.1 Co2+/Mg2+ efflux protein ApaG [Rhizobiaceae bacterium]
MYHTKTHDITVSAMPVYIDERSDPDNSQYFWAYRIVIKNESDIAVQLLRRYWHITDGNGKVEEVAGDGVVGETPTIEPGTSFDYTSGCPLTTPSGIMTGKFFLVDEDGNDLEIAIPAFSLDLPDIKPTYN